MNTLYIKIQYIIGGHLSSLEFIESREISATLASLLLAVFYDAGPSLYLKSTPGFILISLFSLFMGRGPKPPHRQDLLTYLISIKKRYFSLNKPHTPNQLM